MGVILFKSLALNKFVPCSGRELVSIMGEAFVSTACMRGAYLMGLILSVSYRPSCSEWGRGRARGLSRSYLTLSIW